MAKYNETSLYNLKFNNGTGPVPGKWNESKGMWVVNHPWSGPGTEFPDSSVQVIGVLFGTS